MAVTKFMITTISRFAITAKDTTIMGKTVKLKRIMANPLVRNVQATMRLQIAPPPLLNVTNVLGED